MKMHNQEDRKLKRKYNANESNEKLKITQKRRKNSKKLKAILAILACGIFLVLGIIDCYILKSGLFELIVSSITIVIEILMFLKE